MHAWLLRGMMALGVMAAIASCSTNNETGVHRSLVKTCPATVEEASSSDCALWMACGYARHCSDGTVVGVSCSCMEDHLTCAWALDGGTITPPLTSLACPDTPDAGTSDGGTVE